MKIDGMMVIAGVVIIGGLFIFSKRRIFTETLNPLSDKNFAFTGVNNAVGQDNFISAADFIFSNLTLLNPFASEQAKEDARRLQEINREGLE